MLFDSYITLLYNIIRNTIYPEINIYKEKGNEYMSPVKIIPARTDGDIQTIASIADEIWHQHFTPIIGEAQVTYMVEKFQSYPALKAQITDNGYEYLTFCNDGVPCGYI